MIKKVTLLTTLLSLGALVTQAQSVKDALIISQEYNNGTARFKGLGGAQTALGGDISSISGNPAGLGFFGQSDFSVTGSYLNTKNKGSYFGETNSQSKNNFGVDNAGIVLHMPTYRNGGNLDKGWLNFNMGVSYNKTNNFTNHLFYGGTNSNSTIVQSYTDLMYQDQTWKEDFQDTYLVEPYGDASKGFFPITREADAKYQQNELIETGYNSRTNLSFGGNYSNKLYVGVSFGFTSLRYDASKFFGEYGWTKDAAAVAANNPNSVFLDPTNDANQYLNASYDLVDNYGYSSRGSGFDFKLGFIYKPKEDWNIGVTIQTPTWMTISDHLYTYKETSFYDDENADTRFGYNRLEINPIDPTDYNVRTPFKFSLGATKFFSRGLITADAEFVDYSSTRYREIDGMYMDNAYTNYIDDTNNGIKDSYKVAINARLGGEVLINSFLSGRAGVNYFGNPYKNADNSNYNGSLGLGVKLNSSLYLDLAVQHSILKYSESPYVYDQEFWGTSSPIADITVNRTNAVLTLGAKF